MRFWAVPFLIVTCLLPSVVLARGVAPREVVLHPKDVPNNALVTAQTHPVPGYGVCSRGYQSLFGSGFGGTQGLYSAAYRCPSSTTAAQLFPQFLASYKGNYDRPKWDFKLLPALRVGHQHGAWFNAGLPGAVDISGKAIRTKTITVVFQRDDFLALLQVTYVGETLRTAEQSASHLAHIMNRHIVSGR